MPNNYTYTITVEGLRLDAFLVSQLPDLSRSQLQKLITHERVQVNGETAKPRYMVKMGDSVTVTVPDANQALVAESTSLDILFEDEALLVINKPAGMVVHPQLAEEQGTLVHALLHYYPAIAEAVYDPAHSLSRMRPGIVHRLDKDTSGVILVAKTQAALIALSEQFKTKDIKKSYTTVVFGQLKEAQTIRNWIIRKAAQENLMKVSRIAGQGREAITHLFPEKVFAEATLLQCRIETGRTHQIRVHCKFIGHPVLGDTRYTNKAATLFSEKLGIKRQMLHAQSLTFIHPITGKEMTIAAPLPPDMEAVLTALK